LYQFLVCQKSDKDGFGLFLFEMVQISELSRPVLISA